MRWLISSALLLPACFAPDLEDGVISCGEAGCPAGLACGEDGRCYQDPADATARRVALVAANGGGPVRVYAYCAGALREWWRSPVAAHAAVAAGDRDDDHQPDLAIADGDRITLWEIRPEGMSEVGVATAGGVIRDLAWGELDDDGHDELAVVGTGPAEVMHWHHDAYELVVKARTSAPIDALAVTVVPGGRDGGGDGGGGGGGGGGGDELAVGTVGSSLVLLEEEQGVLVTEWSAEYVEDAVDVAVGDDDTVAVATAAGPVRVYQERQNWFEQLWSAADGVGVDAVAWSDDGAPAELAVARSDGVLHVYRGDPGDMTLAWTIPDEGAATALAWGDVDGDGDDDLAVGHAGAPVRVYRNDGDALTLAWSSPAELTVDLEWVSWTGAPDPCP